MAFDDTITERSINPRVMDVPTDNSAAGLVRLAGQALNAGLDAVDDTTKQDYRAELEQVEQQQQAFAEEEGASRGDLNEALSEGDMQRVSLVQSHLNRLRRGEETGMLTPSAANIRRTALLREHAAASPWLVPELKALTASYGGSGGNRGGGSGSALTAREKEWEKIEAESLRYGVSPKVIMDRASLEQRVAHGQNQATASYAGAADSLFDQTALATVDLFAQISAMAKDDPESIDKTNWSQLISMKKTQFYGAISDLARQWSQNGVIMSKEQRNSLRSDVDTQMAMVQSFADAKDKNAFLKNYRENLENSSIIDMHKTNPVAVKVAATYGASAPAIMNAFTKTMHSIRSGTTAAELEQLRALPGQAGLDAEYFFAVLDMVQPNATTAFINSIGSGESTGNPLLDKYANRFAKTLLMDGSMADDPANAPILSKAFKQLTQGPGASLKTFLDNRIYASTFSDPAKVKQIENAINSNVTAVLGDIAGSRIENGEEGAVPRYNVVFSKGKFIRTSIDAASFPSTAFGEEGTAPHSIYRGTDTLAPKISSDLMRGGRGGKDASLEELSTYANLIGMYGIEDKNAWVNDILNEINKQEDTMPDAPDVLPLLPPVPELQGTAAEFIKSKESFRSSAYQDEGGVWTIGYGATEGVKEGDTVTEEGASALLQEDMAFAQRAVDELVEVDLTPDQEAAVTSLVYNVGRDAFAKSKALKALNAGDLATFAEEAFSEEKGFVKVTSGGDKRVSEGLVARRAAEKELGFPKSTPSSKRPQGTTPPPKAAPPPERLADGTYLINGNMVVIKGGQPVPIEEES